ncbi:MAG: winged helix-turn-helix domain-containing protein, partial [Rhodothermales bacterium]|nr:winged helix-turn-helix domain-containing protein [Rhodothermales bacterium]
MNDGFDALSTHRFATGYRIGEWTVLPRSNELTRPGETVRIEPKPMQVLTLLAEHAGDTLTREELLEAVWPDVYVTENALSRCVSQLRKILGDDPREPRVIETIPTVGYRLIAPVHPVGDGADGAAPHSAAEVDLRVTGGPVVATGTVRPAPSARGRWTGVAAGVVAAVAAGALAFALGGRASEAPTWTTRPLTSAPGVEVSPTPSPDGSRVVYIQMTRDRDGDLWIAALGAEEPLQLTGGPAHDGSPAWSPDGSALAFVRCVREAEGRTCAVHAVSALGTDERRLAEGPVEPRGLTYTAGGRGLILVAREDAEGPVRLVHLDLQSGARRPLTAPPATAMGDFRPVRVPGGRHLVFVRGHSSGGNDVYRLDLETGETMRLTHDDRDIAGLTVSPDGRRVVFSSNRSGMYELWAMPPEGGGLERVEGVAARDPGGPALAAGGRLLFEEWAFDINLWAADATGEAEPQRLVASTWWDKHPHLAADGRVAFVSNRSGPPEVWTAAADGSEQRRLTRFGGPSVEAPRWAPDGSRIAFQARPDGQADVYLLDPEGGAPQRLTTADTDDVAPRWSRDGRHVYFGSNRTGAWELWRAPVSGGAPEQMTTDGGYVGEESADGQHLIYAKRSVPGLWTRPLTGGPERRLTGSLRPPDWGSWAVTDAGLLALDRTGGAPHVVRLDPQNGAV